MGTINLTTGVIKIDKEGFLEELQKLERSWRVMEEAYYDYTYVVCANGLREILNKYKDGWGEENGKD